jgi:hypothetical protein
MWAKPTENTMAKIATFIISIIAALLTIITIMWGAIALHNMPITGILAMGAGMIGLLFTTFVVIHLLPRKEVKRDLSVYRRKPIQQDIALSEYRKGYEDALKAACAFKGGEGAFDQQACRIYHLRTLLREAPVHLNNDYIAGWMMQIQEQEAILAEYLKYPTI